MWGQKETTIESGTIKVQAINDAHTKIRKLVERYTEVNRGIATTTQKVLDDWIGKGRNEFESQYRHLISKVDDFGEALQEIYEALVQAEAEYETADDKLRQEIVKQTKK